MKMSNPLSLYFYIIDFALAALIFTIVLILYLTNKIKKFTWNLYWIGFLLGFCWEFTMVFLTEMGIFRFYVYHIPPPLHFMVTVIIHSLWDGGFFLIGYGLVKVICIAPTFERFNIKELGLLLIWGQIQALAVEMISTYSNVWEYIVYWWNPVIFIFNGQNITLWPQIVWLIAQIAFYFIILKLKPKILKELNSA